VAQGGNVTTLASGPGGWSAANTSIVYENLWNGELLDARLEQEGWAAPGFANASAWPSASLAQGTEDRIGPLTPSRAPPVLRGQPLTPAFVTALSPTAHVFDLGPLSNMAGHCGLDLTPPPGEAPVPAGAAIQLLHGELLYANGNGSVWNPYLPPWGTGQGALNSPHMNYTYVTRGGGRELMHRGPHFAYFGFKFIELRGWPYAAPPRAAPPLRPPLRRSAAPRAAAHFYVDMGAEGRVVDRGTCAEHVTKGACAPAGACPH
jgi:alpha-L-rhamnosidase